MRVISIPFIVRFKNFILPSNTFLGNRFFYLFFKKCFIFKTIFGFKIFINLGQSLSKNIFFNYKIYCKKEFQLITNYFKDGNVFVDVGSNIGYYSLFVASKFPKSSIISIEGDPETYKLLENNVLVNGFVNIDCTNSLLSGKNELISFYRNFLGDIGANSVFKRNETANKIILKTETLNSILESRNVKKIDFLKIDIEGSEFDVLQNYFGSISDIFFPTYILFEDRESPNPDQVFILKELLKKNDYVILYEGNNTLVKHQKKC